MRILPTKRSCLARLVRAGVAIDTVVDVGVLEGTPALIEAFPRARHLLFEPFARFNARIEGAYAGVAHELHNVACFSEDGECWLVASSPFGSAEVTHTRIAEQPATPGVDGVVSCEPIRRACLDSLPLSLGEHVLLKVDVDGVDLEVLKGAVALLARTDVVVVEAPLVNLLERANFLAAHGFRLYDIVDLCYYHHILHQVDLVFVKEGLFGKLPALNPWSAGAFSPEAYRELTEQLEREEYRVTSSRQDRLAPLRENLRSVVAGAPLAAGPLDVVVTPNEINDLHGTGFLVKRMFAGWRSVLSLRIRDDYGGVHDFGFEAHRLDVKGLRRPNVYRTALDVLARRPVGRVFSVPYTAEDLLLALAIHDVTGAPLCIWIMDDQCVATSNLPRSLMQEALERSALRLATHHELREAYEAAFGLPFGILPAAVPAALIRREPARSPPPGARGALLGSVWSRRWLDLLAAAVRGAGVELDWYGNHRAPVLGLTDGDLAAMPFRPHGIVPEPALAAALASYAFVVVPTGTLEGEAAEQHALAELSLPGRILFAVAVAHAPILVIGSERTPAAAFVRRHRLGLAIPYDAAALGNAVRTLCDPAEQARIRAAAAALAPSLSDEGVGAWLSASIGRGSPVDDRFERVFPRPTPA